MRKQILLTTTCWLALLSFMLATPPDKLPVVILIVPFLLLFTVLLQTWALIQLVVLRYVLKNSGYSKSTRLAKVFSAGLTLLIVLQSLGQLTMRDVITIFTIGLIGYLYTGRAHSQQV